MRRATFHDLADINRWNERDMGKEVDFSGFLANEMNVCLLEGEGGAFFVWRGPGIYEVHVFFVQRGGEVIRLSHRMLEHMREQFGAWLFWAAVPWANTDQSRRVRMFTRLMGWKSWGRKEMPHGLCEIFSGE